MKKTDPPMTREVLMLVIDDHARGDAVLDAALYRRKEWGPEEIEAQAVLRSNAMVEKLKQGGLLDMTFLNDTRERYWAAYIPWFDVCVRQLGLRLFLKSQQAHHARKDTAS